MLDIAKKLILSVFWDRPVPRKQPKSLNMTKRETILHNISQEPRRRAFFAACPTPIGPPRNNPHRYFTNQVVSLRCCNANPSLLLGDLRPLQLAHENEAT